MKLTNLLTMVIGLVLAVALTACSIKAQTSSDTATFTWTAPTTFTDGTTIPTSDVITYDTFVGTAGKGSEPGGPTAAGLSVLTWIGSGYAPGTTVCGVVTAIVNGVMSSPSNEACKSFPAVPNPPTNLAVK